LAYIDEAETEAGIGMTEDELQVAVRQYIEDAIQFIDDDISPIRAESTRYYNGEPFGNEVDGRSQVVSRDVRDSVQAMLPSLMRVFFGAENMVEFVPRGPEDVGMAEQATDYVNYILREDNDSVGIFYSVFKDALINKGGIVKWSWDDSLEVHTYSFEGLDQATLGLLLDEEGVEAVSVEGIPDPNAPPEQIEMMTAQGMEPPMIYDVEIKRQRRRDRVRVETMPPEEFFVDSAATSLDDAMVVGHRTMATVSDLVAMGYDKDMLDNYLSDEVAFTDNDEYWARYPDRTVPGPLSSYNQRRVLYVEAYCYIDYDGDGLAELRRVCTVGSNYHLVNNEPIHSIPFAVFSCDPEPHVFFGSDVADMTKDIQRVKSAVLRGMLDSLSFALYPRTGIVEGQVDIDDVLNPEVGSIIRMRAPGMVQQLNVPFLGREAFPMMEYLDGMKESRTGVTGASQGLDPDVLQSTTRAAVSATIRGAEQRLEMIARLFAETGFKPLFKGLLRLIIEHQDQQRMVRLRNEWTPVDPRIWDATMDVSTNVGLGSGMTDERLNTLNQIAGRQEQIMQQMGPNNPLVGLGQIRHTLAKILEVSGFKDSNQFFNPIPPDYQPPPPPPPKPTPEEQLAQVQMADIQARTAIDQEKLQLDATKAQMLNERETTRIAGDLALREKKFEDDVELEMLRAAIKREADIIDG
tara:strand:+ start:1060 stop:3129 length:2070 start_codon:yes stop_codon:yes gene_type:complete